MLARDLYTHIFFGLIFIVIPVNYYTFIQYNAVSTWGDAVPERLINDDSFIHNSHPHSLSLSAFYRSFLKKKIYLLEKSLTNILKFPKTLMFHRLIVKRNATQMKILYIEHI